MSEGIGAFTIGQTPIGTPPFDYKQTIIAQYANSPTITGIISAFSAAADPSADIDNFFDYVWNIDTAQGFGLDIWGRILGIGRVYPVSDLYHFGFNEAQGSPTKDVGAFGQGVFWLGSGPTGNFALADIAYRRLLLAKAMANISACTIPALNSLLRFLFPGRGNAYVRDNGAMSMTYAFDFVLTPVEVTVVTLSGVLPRPAGVAMTITHL